MAETTPTREVLGLTRHRVAGLVHDGLRLSELTRESYLSLLLDPTLEPDSTAQLNRLAVAAFRQREFCESVANSLSPEFASLFWAKLVESLSLNPSCQFSGFGTFNRANYGPQLTISFDPAMFLSRYAQSAPPSIKEFFAKDKAAEERVDNVALDVLAQVLAKSIGKPAVRPETTLEPTPDVLYPQPLPELLKSGLPSLASTILDDFPKLAVLPASDAITAVAFVTALYTYYAWTVAFQLHLSTFPKMTVASIGRFLTKERQFGISSKDIAFEADEVFRDVVRFNAPPPAAAPPIAA